MGPGRCLHLLPVMGLALAGTLALGGPPLLAAGRAAWVPPACGSGGAPPGEHVAWYRTDPVLDSTGTLAGVQLLTGGGSGPARVLVLEPEAFASGPVLGRVIAGDDDGSRSVLRALDPARGCTTLVATVRDAVIRSAVATADGRALYEHRVDRRTRADLGIWRRELDGWMTRGPARRVLDPMPPDPAYGPTFSTELLVAPTGDIVAASCGELACRTRILAPDGRVRVVGPTGPALGMVDGSLVARDACSGLPCPVVAYEGEGSRRLLVRDARLAALGGVDGGIVVVETAAGRLRAVDVRSGSGWSVDADGVLPVRGGSLATSGATSGPGEIVLAPGGRVRGTASLQRVLPAKKEVAP